MKAIRLSEYGGQLVFNDVPTPTIARDEILVKIKSTANGLGDFALLARPTSGKQLLRIGISSRD